MKKHHLTDVVAFFAILVVIVAMSVTGRAYAGGNDDVSQNLIAAYHVGKEIGHPETLQALLLKESGGVSGRVGNPKSKLTQRSYGLMQVQIVAARSVLKHNDEMREEYFPARSLKTVSDAELADLLLNNDTANLRIAAHHFKIYFKLTKGNWDTAVAAYNRGIGGVRLIEDPASFDYVVSVRRHLERVKAFNRKHDLR